MQKKSKLKQTLPELSYSFRFETPDFQFNFNKLEKLKAPTIQSNLFLKLSSLLLIDNLNRLSHEYFILIFLLFLPFTLSSELLELTIIYHQITGKSENIST
jgi:hypothetical protein